VKKVLLWLYGKEHGITWFYLGVLGWMIVALVNGFFNFYSTMSTEALLIMMTISFIAPSVLFYQIGRVFIARARNYKYVLVEFDRQERAFNYGEYLWRRRGFIYKNALTDIDGCVEFNLPGLSGRGRWDIHVTFKVLVLSRRSAIEENPLAYYAEIALQRNGKPFCFQLLNELTHKITPEMTEEIFDIIFGDASDWEKDKKILALIAPANPFNKVARATITIERKTGIVLLHG
jgi:hypothetical protein